jgi:HEPN domain-containing protein
MNKTAAKEWLVIAYHDLKSAEILYEANHYTDSIGNDLQQCIEKTLKSILAYKNQKIPKSHDLLEIAELVDLQIEEDDYKYLALATEYFKEERYPNPNYFLPPKEEIKNVLDFTKKLFDKVLKKLQISLNEIK